MGNDVVYEIASKEVKTKEWIACLLRHGWIDNEGSCDYYDDEGELQSRIWYYSTDNFCLYARGWHFFKPLFKCLLEDKIIDEKDVLKITQWPGDVFVDYYIVEDFLSEKEDCFRVVDTSCSCVWQTTKKEPQRKKCKECGWYINSHYLLEGKSKHKIFNKVIGESKEKLIFEIENYKEVYGDED